MSLVNFSFVLGYEALELGDGARASDYVRRFESEMALRGLDGWERQLFETELREEQGLPFGSTIRTKLSKPGTLFSVNSRVMSLMAAGIGWEDFREQFLQAYSLFGQVAGVKKFRLIGAHVSLEAVVVREVLDDHFVMFGTGLDEAGQLRQTEHRTSFQVADGEEVSVSWMFLDGVKDHAPRARAESGWRREGPAGVDEVEGLVDRGKGFLDEGIRLVVKERFLGLFG